MKTVMFADDSFRRVRHEAIFQTVASDRRGVRRATDGGAEFCMDCVDDGAAGRRRAVGFRGRWSATGSRRAGRKPYP